MEANEGFSIREGNETLDLKTYGFRSAINSQGNSNTISDYLNVVYSQSTEYFRKNNEGSIERLELDRKNITNNLSLKKSKISELNSEINKNQFDIENLERSKIETITEDSVHIDVAPFYIGSFITLLLTFYLFVFYSSSGYSAFYGVKKGSLGFISSNVFNDAVNKGGGVIALIILFPVIFLGLGFLIHDNLEKNKLKEKAGKKKNYWMIISLLTITFIADAFIGYKISEGIHNNNFLTGVVTKEWRFDMVFIDINFYLVLLLGFVVYVIWGFLLHFVLSHNYLKGTPQLVKLEIEQIDKRIGELKEKTHRLTIAAGEAEREMTDLERDLEKLDYKLNRIKGGSALIDIESLKGFIGEFISGWLYYLSGYYTDGIKRNATIDEVVKQKDLWLVNKMQNLDNL